jgi:hypothetical protein
MENKRSIYIRLFPSDKLTRQCVDQKIASVCGSEYSVDDNGKGFLVVSMDAALASKTASALMSVKNAACYTIVPGIGFVSISNRTN